MPPASSLAGGRDPFDLALSEEKAYCAEIYHSPWPAWPDGSVWTVPGRGRSCGRGPHRPLLYRGCPGHHAVPYVDSCDGRACPVCWRDGWMSREAGNVADVLFAERGARRTRGLRSGIIHVSVNPPPFLWGLPDTKEGFARLRALAYEKGREAGFDGGAWVFHRERCEDKDDPLTTDGPHFHGLGFGWIDGEQFKRTGWTVRNHGLRMNRRSVVGTAKYVLSHSWRAEGISPEGKSEGRTLTVTWTGRLVRASEIPEPEVFCPLCGHSYPKGEWLRLEWAGQGPPPTEPVPMREGDWFAYALDQTGCFGRSRRVST
jgi:hypothetical protein